ncbi:hypothetical protein C6P40_003382 [Pichia californica]|uniref:Protein kinase domain-containing protein n=1 Tax=Pichia californica TaxID=460514 RepID=A0A9P6WQG6_9ASCO|nr:hypothetical protein C6P40_003382 [[Candida] californica]
MLDLFKNIINKKVKDPKDLKDLKNNSQINPIINPVNSNLSSSKQELKSKNKDKNKDETEYIPNSINVLLEIHPELEDYYTELHTRYLLSEKIGEGAFSNVYKAYDLKDSNYLAIKIIDKSNLNSDQINSILKEIAIMRQLNNSNIVKLFNYQNCLNSKYCFLFLEYVSGGEIFNQIIKFTYFSENLSRHILRQVAFAVKYLHDKDIVHRDIKPENLLFEPSKFIKRSINEQIISRRKSDDENKVDEGKFLINSGSGGIGIVKLADFGLSTHLKSSNSLAKTPCGTVGYTSPEQHMNIGYDKKVDMWALGCVLYTMVVGFPPFYSNNQDSNDITEKVMKGEYQFLKPWFDEISDGCKNLISNLLTVDPAKRYSIDQLLSDPWLNLGYENYNENFIDLNKISSPADDAPKSDFLNDELNKTFSEDLINNSNVDDYFAGYRVTSDEGQIMTPRAEAIKLVFDTAKDVQKNVINSPNKINSNDSSIKSSSNNNNNNNDNNNIIDFMSLDKPTRYISNTDSISDLETESDDSSNYSNSKVHRFSEPVNINDSLNISNSDIKNDANDDDDDDDDDLSLDSEELDDDNDDDTEDYPITLTSLNKIKSHNKIKRNNLIESSTSSCLSPAHSRGTTVTLTTQTSTRAPSIKSWKSFKSSQSIVGESKTPTNSNLNSNIQDLSNNNILQTKNGCKSSISFDVNPSMRSVSGSVTSNSSHVSEFSNSSITSVTSNSSGHVFNMAPSGLEEVDEITSEEEEDDDDSEFENHDTENEWEDRTPSASNSVMGIQSLKQLSHLEFRNKCKAHTPYVFKNDNDKNENYLPEDGYIGGTESNENSPSGIQLSLKKQSGSSSLEQKLSEHGVVNLQLDSSTILSRRKMKTEKAK